MLHNYARPNNHISSLGKKATTTTLDQAPFDHSAKSVKRSCGMSVWDASEYDKKTSTRLGP